MIFFASNFILNEGKQLRDTGTAYFFDAMNYLDMIPFILITFVSINYIVHSHRYESEVGFMATSSMFMWFKVLSFGRVHKETAYMIRMLVQVFYDIGAFMIILFLTLLAFADASYTVSKAIKPVSAQYFPKGYW